MAETNRTGNQEDARTPRPEDARQDAENLERQRQVERDRDALQAQAERVEATAPPEVEMTINEMTREAERKAEADRRR
jgi:hypothetical protein